ncbi:MAG: hypothetical protein JO083_07430 [Candidatus Eremiobacteraeota bacterium]|nr:hypothetical protein [Candidatus Eremiobacteraeota bacterium]
MSNAEDGLIVKLGRTAALACSLLLAAGCGGGGGSSPAPAGPSAPAPTPTPTPAPALFPSGSSAASYILANVNPSQTSVSRAAPSDQDDGGWSQLQLPALQPCGNGALATDCKVWIFAPAAGSSSARTPRTPIVGSRPPTFNFCRDAASYPGDLGRPAIPVTGLGGQSFSLAYSGTKTLPVVAFATRWWTVSLTNTFAGNATIAPAIGVTPTQTSSAARGWLLFFTWSWPADVLAIPFQINEIQLAASSSPMAIPPGNSAPLGAFDCLGRPITATAAQGSGFGFSPDLSTTSVTSSGAELNVPLYTGPTPSGSAVLYDDQGAVVATPVT